MSTPPLHDDLADLNQRRERMIDWQLIARGVRDRRVLAAMSGVAREEFVPHQLQREAYEDQPLPIGFGQTISQPYTVAFMAQALQLQGDERILEIGTGSGYGAAVLGLLATEVHTVERNPTLAKLAEARFQQLGIDNVLVHTCDGTLGLAEHAPYDAIIVTAGANQLPQPYVDQLSEGGRIVIPIGRTRTSQTLCRYTRRGEDIVVEDLGPFAFVPLIGKHGWHE